MTIPRIARAAIIEAGLATVGHQRSAAGPELSRIAID
jgi:hypothetical protein